MQSRRVYGYGARSCPAVFPALIAAAPLESAVAQGKRIFVGLQARSRGRRRRGSFTSYLNNSWTRHFRYIVDLSRQRRQKTPGQASRGLLSNHLARVLPFKGNGDTPGLDAELKQWTYLLLFGIFILAVGALLFLVYRVEEQHLDEHIRAAQVRFREFNTKASAEAGFPPETLSTP